MKRSLKVVLCLQVAAFVYLCAAPVHAQISQINPAKLPQNAAIQHVYTDLQPIEQYARVYQITWRYPVPRSDVRARLLLALNALRLAQTKDPYNTELQLFAGLVAHLAYNLGIEDSNDDALRFLKPLADGDIRAAWFLGIHQCQSRYPVTGMKRLLSVDASSATLPGAFWQDYANCAGEADMPVHEVRAYDNAKTAGDGTTVDAQREQIARDRLKPTSNIVHYSSRETWHTEPTGTTMRSTSNACGLSFAVPPSFRLNLGDVVNGMCVATMDTDAYPSRYGPSSASLLVLTQTAKPGQTLEDFSKIVMKDPRYDHKEKIFEDEIHCPVKHCIAWEITTNKLYKEEGGAHLFAVFFESEQPVYPGLRFETPQPVPNISEASADPASFRSEEVLQRFNGTLYHYISLDANHDIYPRSRTDFDDLLKSLVIDTKDDTK
jgi:hypothetical protein